MITQDALKSVLSYDPDTGVFRWLKSRRGVRDILNAGAPMTNGYRTICIDGGKYLSHRLAWLYVHGEFPPEDMDHINGKRDDNRLCNLRPVTRYENTRNTKLRKENISGYHGVTWDKSKKRWQAKVERRHIGYYREIDDAIEARLAAQVAAGCFHENHGRAV